MRLFHQGGECVIGDLRFGRCDGGQEGGLARVRETDETDIGKDLQFQDEPAFDPFLAGLGIARRLVGGRLEMVVAPTAAATLAQKILT